MYSQYTFCLGRFDPSSLRSETDGLFETNNGSVIYIGASSSTTKIQPLIRTLKNVCVINVMCSLPDNINSMLNGKIFTMLITQKYRGNISIHYQL